MPKGYIHNENVNLFICKSNPLSIRAAQVTLLLMNLLPILIWKLRLVVFFPLKGRICVYQLFCLNLTRLDKPAPQ